MRKVAALTVRNWSGFGLKSLKVRGIQAGRRFCSSVSGIGSSGNGEEQPAGKRSKLRPDLFSEKSLAEIGDISHHDMNKFVNLGPDGFFKKAIPEFFSGSGTTRYQEPILLREHMLNLLQVIKSFPTEEIKRSRRSLLLLDGDRGVGKSTALLLMVLQARASGWLTIFLPNPRSLVVEKFALETGTGTAQAIVRSKLPISPGPSTNAEAGEHLYFAQPLAAQRILKDVEANHKEVLTRLPQKRQYEHNFYVKRSSKSKDAEQTLYTIVERGLRDLQLANNCLWDLRQEMNLVENYPVLIAVDEFNCLYWPSAFYAKSKHVPTHELLVPKTFRCLDEDGNIFDDFKMKNGLLVCATTKHYKVPFYGFREIANKRDFYPNGLLYQPFNVHQNFTESAYEKLTRDRSVEVVKVGNYNDTEMKQIVKYHQSLVKIDAATEEALSYFSPEMHKKFAKEDRKYKDNLALFARLTQRNPKMVYDNVFQVV